MKQVVHFTGDNYSDVLNIVPGYVRCNRHYLRLHIFIPMEGDIALTSDCYIINDNNKIEVVYE